MKHLSKFQYSPFLIPKFRYSIFPFLSLLRYSIFNIRYSIFFFLLLSLLLFPPSLPAQEWTEPISVTNNMGGFCTDPDLVFDHSGILHVVWSYEIDYSYRKIMYSSSADFGETWIAPLDLLQNNDLWMSQPHIDCDSKNNLYVAYTHNTINVPEMMVKMVIYDGYEWSDPILVSEEMPGSDYPKVITDNNDQIFLGFHKGGKFYYRLYSDFVLSEIYCPYCNWEDIYLPVEGVLAENNKIHWIGSSASYNYYGERLEYFLFDIGTNSWSNPQMPVQDTIKIGKDITLDNNSNPVCVYRKKPFGDDRTKLIQKNGNYWSNPELVACVDGSQKYQQIEIDQNNDVHIVEQQETVEGYGLVHYKKWNEKWVGQFIDSCYIVNFPKLLFNNNRLYFVYSKTWVVGKEFDGDLFFTRYDIVTGQMELPEILPELDIYPNPGRDN
nr:hypothetical protein [Bacteroidota bacterium]